MSVALKVVIFELAFWLGIPVFLFSDVNYLLLTSYFVLLGLMSFYIRCPNCRKGVFVRELWGAPLFVVPWPNALCTRCGTVLFGPGSDLANPHDHNESAH